MEVPAVPGAAKQVGALWSLPDGTKDTYDGETGVLVRRVGKLVFDGSTSNLSKAAIGINAYRVAGNPTVPAIVPADNVIANIWCNRMVAISLDTAKTMDDYGVSIASNSQASVADGVIRISLPTTVAGSVESAKTWLSTHPIVVCFPLAQPIVERIVYTGAIPTRATDLLAPSWVGKTTVTGTPSPDSPTAIAGVPFAATATGPDGQTRSVDLGITGYSLPDGTADSYDGETGAVVRRVLRLVLNESNIRAFGMGTLTATNVCIFLSTQADTIYTYTPKKNMICSHFPTANGWQSTIESIFAANAAPPYTIFVNVSLSRLAPYGYVEGNNESIIISAKAWLKAQADAGTPVIVLYELEQPIAYHEKADLSAFDGKTTVTGADAVEVIEGQVIRPYGLMAYEVLRSNPNLARNPSFEINQRAKQTYQTVSALETVDGWIISTSNGAVSSVRLTVNGDRTVTIESLLDTSTGINFSQIEEDSFAGKIVTFSFILKEANAKTNISLRRKDWSVYAQKEIPAKPGLCSITAAIPKTETSNLRIAIGVQNIGSYRKFTVESPKLEIAGEQTNARKVGGQWVLNDPPPDPTLELLKCQKYQLAVDANMRLRAVDVVSSQIDFWCPIPTAMRIVPIIETPNSLAVTDIRGVVQSGFSFEIPIATNNGFLLRAKKENHGMTDAGLRTTALTIFSANL